MERNSNGIKLSLFGLLVVLLNFYSITASKCDRTPEGFVASKSPANGKFRIRITGNPDRYSPGQQYIISLVGIESMQLQQKFTSFLLAVEGDSNDNRDPFTSPQIASASNAGIFQLYGDALTKFSIKCPNVVTQTSTIPKKEVQVLWTAPASGSGCVVFRATVVEHRDIWYMDDGPLSRLFCEDDADSIDTQPPIETRCCACDEAKYELTFEGLWSRHTHPKDFPSNGWLTRFSDVIGASHTVDYRFWEYGKLASEGLRQVAEHGATRMLESELKEQSEHIRTIIKARGISYPNVTGKTFAVFRVDSLHHLVSLVSMLDPSPDWIVGVSGLELCLPNCTWIENKVLNLYPWDAGTDSGPTYISPDQPTNPREVIKRIKSTSPNDPRSPFYDSTGGEMKPLARLYLSRQRLYEKTCDLSLMTEDDSSDVCATGLGTWSECSVTCGKGKRTLQLQYLNPGAAHAANCNAKLTKRKECVGAMPYCESNDNEEENTEAPDPECQVTEFGPWGKCDPPCGKGNKTRTRTFVGNREVRKRCKVRSNSPKLIEVQECELECTGDLPEPLTMRQMRRNERCRTTDWSDWSPCSASCGLGRRMRNRIPINKGLDTQAYHNRMIDYFNRDNSGEDDNEELQDNFIRNMDPNDPCVNLKMVEEEVCGHHNPSCSDMFGNVANQMSEQPNFCSLEPAQGHCRNAVNKWYFDAVRNHCGIFTYSGCGGNNNNFESQDDCISTCRNRHFGSIPIRDLTSDTALEHHHHHNHGGTRIDCKMSHWIRGQCNVTCGAGHRVKSRTILTHPKNGGNTCPHKLRKHEKCYIACDPGYDMNPSWGPSTRVEPEVIECIYSEWSAWSPCSRTCGESAVQQRTRAVINPDNVIYCPHRLEQRKCDIMPCLLGHHGH